jgi:hypothetical protein
MTSPSTKGERQIQKLAEAKAAPRAADIVADVWVSDLLFKGIKHVTGSAARAANDMVDECMGLMEDDPVKRAIIGKILKTGAQRLESALRDFDGDDFGIFGR